MTAVIWSPTARRDLAEIHAWLARRNTYAARQIVLRIRDKVALLQRHALLGVSRQDIALEARMLSIPPYTVLYEIADDTLQRQTVRIIRILDARRDLTELL